MTAISLLALLVLAVAVQIVVAVLLGRSRRAVTSTPATRLPSPDLAATSAGGTASASDGDGIDHAIPHGTLAAALFSSEVVPFALALCALLATTLLFDALLHALNIAWVGRYLGIPGVLLIVLSFGHTLRKRGIIKSRDPMRLMRLHERMAWLGSLLILVHAGVHFNAILAWLAVGAMVINVGSGLTGKFLLARVRRRLDSARQQMRDEGLSAAEIEERLQRDSLTFGIVRQWRIVHFPITLAFAVLALAHIVSALLFWSWS